MRDLGIGVVLVAAVMTAGCDSALWQGQPADAGDTVGQGDGGSDAGSPDAGSICGRRDYAIHVIARSAGVRVSAATAQVQGDESATTLHLPWAFPLFGRQHTDLAADTNGNLWFGATSPTVAHDFDLATGVAAGLPVLALWNTDHTSEFYGEGTQLELLDSPPRLVVDFEAERKPEADADWFSNVNVVLAPTGHVLVDYRYFDTHVCTDQGSGLSAGDGVQVVSVTTALGGPVCEHPFTTVVLDPPCRDSDSDDDGLDDADETVHGTGTQNPDSDGDGWRDGWEVWLLASDPLTAN